VQGVGIWVRDVGVWEWGVGGALYLPHASHLVAQRMFEISLGVRLVCEGGTPRDIQRGLARTTHLGAVSHPRPPRHGSAAVVVRRVGARLSLRGKALGAKRFS
jgi:hypothetical protein